MKNFKPIPVSDSNYKESDDNAITPNLRYGRDLRHCDEKKIKNFPIVHDTSA